MKKILLAIVLLTAAASCDEMGKCKDIKKSVMTLLFDVSDEELFSNIQQDVRSNFGRFMQDTKFGRIDECEDVEMILAILSAKDELINRRISISIDQKGLSFQERKKRADPTKLVDLLKTSLIDYAELSKDSVYNTSTSVLQTVIKSIVSVDESKQHLIVIFSDMVENNKNEKINFYKIIPKDIGGTIRQLVDRDLLSKFRNLEISDKLKLIVVLKNVPGNTKKRDIKEFWLKCFHYLDIEQVQFLDNLSNNIGWD